MKTYTDIIIKQLKDNDPKIGTELELPNGLRPFEIDNIIEALGTNKNVQKVNFHKNKLTEFQIEEIKKLLEKNITLISIDFISPQIPELTYSSENTIKKDLDLKSYIEKQRLNVGEIIKEFQNYNTFEDIKNHLIAIEKERVGTQNDITAKLGLLQRIKEIKDTSSFFSRPSQSEKELLARESDVEEMLEILKINLTNINARKEVAIKLLDASVTVQEKNNSNQMYHNNMHKAINAYLKRNNNLERNNKERNNKIQEKRKIEEQKQKAEEAARLAADAEKTRLADLKKQKIPEKKLERPVTPKVESSTPAAKQEEKIKKSYTYTDKQKQIHENLIESLRKYIIDKNLEIFNNKGKTVTFFGTDLEKKRDLARKALKQFTTGSDGKPASLETLFRSPARISDHLKMLDEEDKKLSTFSGELHKIFEKAQKEFLKSEPSPPRIPPKPKPK